MAKIEEIPNDKQFFTIADLVGQGLTIYRIDKFVRDGRLIKRGNNIYENPDFQRKSEEEKKHPASVLNNERLMTFLPPLLMSDLNGLERSVVHYVVPGQLDSLQLVQIGVQAAAPSYHFGPSIRDHHLIHFVLKGSGEVMINDQSFLVNAGQIFYSPKGSQWYIKSNEENPWEYLWVGFCGKWADQLLSLIGLTGKNLLADIKDMSAIMAVREQLARAMERDSSYLSMMPHFWTIIQELGKTTGYAPNLKKKMGDQSGKRQEPKIVEVVQHIETHYMDQISVNTLAYELSISRAWLSRSFKKLTGKTIKEYIKDLRISHAKDLLTQTPLPISEVAEACGYQNPLFFSRVFRQETGYAPTDWRKGK